ncbi:hypothetical protein [Bacteroides faecalis]|uniref:Uncharacterized protein n=1 Tax=Bacteroides faecalis TaxID=2447885 RepID=A0A401LTK5_9BACE|nr:hypothetical protein [Bacteroides faecalis]GCB34793.1 hypothetical protein KGMB02408_17380 [Bacteroides faecalis]
MKLIKWKQEVKRNNENKKQTVKEKEYRIGRTAGWNFCPIHMPAPKADNGQNERQNINHI